MKTYKPLNSHWEIEYTISFYKVVFHLKVGSVVQTL